MSSPRVTLLGGGVGSSRLVAGLVRIMDPQRLTVVVNTGDDHWRYGLRICPDLDTNLYALAGHHDVSRGWGIAGDTFTTMDRLRALGDDAWFNLGDRDLATHLMRTDWLHQGRPLSWVTAELSHRLSVTTTLIPATDSPVETRIRTPDGELDFEEWFVHRAAHPPVTAVEFLGAPSAPPAPGVIDAIAGADLVVIGPSNPVASIGPIFAVDGIRAAVATASVPVVAVTPVVTGIKPSTDGDRHRSRARAALLHAWGLDHRASAVARWYGDLLDGFVIDEADPDEVAALEGTHITVVPAPTLRRHEGAAVDLARIVLQWAGPNAGVDPGSVR